MISIKEKDIGTYITDIENRCDSWDLSSDLVYNMENDINLEAFHSYLQLMKQMSDVLERYKLLLIDDADKIKKASTELLECDQKIGQAILSGNIK